MRRGTPRYQMGVLRFQTQGKVSNLSQLLPRYDRYSNSQKLYALKTVTVSAFRIYLLVTLCSGIEHERSRFNCLLQTFEPTFACVQSLTSGRFTFPTSVIVILSSASTILHLARSEEKQRSELKEETPKSG
jgi:hypothetical protein